MATKRVYVLRHAKSSWDDPRLRDHERPLAPRGLRATKVLREHLRSEGIEPALVLCSSARRALDTLEGVNPASGRRLIEPELYGADVSALLDRLRQVPGELPSVMVIGHNPAMQLLVLRLAGDRGDADPAGERASAGPEAPADVESDLAQVRRKFPTGGLATLEFECEWGELGIGRARLTALVRPKQLAGG